MNHRIETAIAITLREDLPANFAIDLPQIRTAEDMDPGSNPMLIVEVMGEETIGASLYRLRFVLHLRITRDETPTATVSSWVGGLRDTIRGSTWIPAVNANLTFEKITHWHIAKKTIAPDGDRGQIYLIEGHLFAGALT